MLKRIIAMNCMLALAGAYAQDNPPAPAGKFYQLDFVVKEVEGSKTVNARSYSTTVTSDERSTGASIRTGSRVPYPTGSGGSFQYMDVGVNIDTRTIREHQGSLSIHVTADISSVAEEPAQGAAPPMLRQNKWSGTAFLPAKKPSVIFSSDDVTSKRTMQLELTVTPLR